uniref:Uncharacterized protein n=1 Tax=Anguilla anguilla TaxID=7936 RepID=A0A0E9QQL9_ANGAN
MVCMTWDNHGVTTETNVHGYCVLTGNIQTVNMLKMCQLLLF